MKADHADFREFLSTLPKKLDLERARSYWPQYAFHFTDVRNAAKILEDGRIISRANLQEDSFIDGACPSVIAHTDREVSDYVRLYFRPRTPTQYRSEGIRPVGYLWHNAHCPVPVFFLFDLPSLLVRDDSKFSVGNLARLGFSGLCSTAKELSNFEFDKIYHVDWVSNEERDDIISHRNAEIVIPRELELSSLRWIYCRTAAEKETLLYLLNPDVRERWARKIVVATTATLFYRNWVFVETATLNEQRVILNFSPDTQVGGPFNLRIIRKPDEKTKTQPQFFARGRVSIDFASKVWRYGLEVYLDNHLAYAASFDRSEEIPF